MRNRVTRVMSHPVPRNRNRVIGSGTRVFLLYFICVGPLCDFKKRACKMQSVRYGKVFSDFFVGTGPGYNGILLLTPKMNSSTST